MPDFVTVMKEWRRMCKASVEAGMKDGQGCMHHCILPDDFCGDLCCAKESDIIEAEHAIMKWAREHPEPLYPTWTEYFRMTGVFPPWYTNAILDTTHIDTKTAKMLGLEPKEAES